MTLLAHQHPELRYFPIQFKINAQEDASSIVASHGVDVVRKTCHLPNDKLCIFLLDNRQQQYQNIAFWTALIKALASWMPPHIRFIISATHLLETDIPESPIAFSSIRSKLTRDNFLMSDKEAHQLINLENGLPLELRFPTSR